MNDLFPQFVHRYKLLGAIDVHGDILRLTQKDHDLRVEVLAPDRREGVRRKLGLAYKRKDTRAFLIKKSTLRVSCFITE